MKSKATGFKGQTTIVQDAAHFGFNVINHRFVLHCQDAVRQHRIPVRHQTGVIAKVAGNVFLTIGKGLTGRKQLLEATKTGRHGMPTGVNNLGVGQDHLNQPNMLKIVRHLIDKKRRVAPLHLRSEQIFLSEFQALRCRQF